MQINKRKFTGKRKQLMYKRKHFSQRKQGNQ